MKTENIEIVEHSNLSVSELIDLEETDDLPADIKKTLTKKDYRKTSTVRKRMYNLFKRLGEDEWFNLDQIIVANYRLYKEISSRSTMTQRLYYFSGKHGNKKNIPKYQNTKNHKQILIKHPSAPGFYKLHPDAHKLIAGEYGDE